jgi:isoleucyl-tRNA synthetase
VSDRIALTLAFADAEDGAAVRSAFDIADIAGETLALGATVDGVVVAGTAGDTASAPGYAADFAAGAFANRGGFTVGVTRIGGAA